jgi:hypothetical protein
MNEDELKKNEFRFEDGGEGRFYVNGREVSREEFEKELSIKPKTGPCYINGVQVSPEEFDERTRVRS